MRAAAAWFLAGVLISTAILFPTRAVAQSGSFPRNRGFFTIQEIFNRRCASCHAWASSYKGIAQPARIVALVPEDTLLFRQVADGAMPASGPMLSKDEIALIRAWIAAHAPSGNTPLVEEPLTDSYPNGSEGEVGTAPQPCSCGEPR